VGENTRPDQRQSPAHVFCRKDVQRSTQCPGSYNRPAGDGFLDIRCFCPWQAQADAPFCRRIILGLNRSHPRYQLAWLGEWMRRHNNMLVTQPLADNFLVYHLFSPLEPFRKTGNHFFIYKKPAVFVYKKVNSKFSL
jgi:hypothetical protein